MTEPARCQLPERANDIKGQKGLATSWHYLRRRLQMSLITKISELIFPPQYKVIDGVTYVKEGFTGWETLKEHLKREHPEEYRKLWNNHEKRL